MDLNTDSKKDALKLTMKILGHQKEVDRREICKILTTGNKPYSRSEDAARFLSDLVGDESFPVEKDGNYLKRTDVREVRI